MSENENDNPRIIGPIKRKPYECTVCHRVYETETNHYGEIYPFCPVCRTTTVHRCLLPVPEGWSIPEPWTLVRLGDIAEIVKR